MIILILTIPVAVYLISAWAMWYWVFLTYSSKGISSGSNPEVFDLFIVLCPIFNTVWALGFWGFQSPIKGKPTIGFRVVQRLTLFIFRVDDKGSK